MQPMTSGDLEHSDLIKWVRSWVPSVSEKGVCDGTTSMWIQAFFAGELHVFYDRFRELSLYLSSPNHTIASLKAEVDEIYASLKLKPGQESGHTREELTPEQFKIMELRPFAESVGLQQAPGNLGIFSTFMHQNAKNILFPLTASVAFDRGGDLCLLSDFPNLKELGGKIYIEREGNKLKYILSNIKGERVDGFFELPQKILAKLPPGELTPESLHKLTPDILEELGIKGHIRQIKSDIVGTVGLPEQELVKYLDAIKEKLIQDSKENKEKGAFLLCSDNHAVGMYWDVSIQKWHFFDVNYLTGETNYHTETESKQLASIIFKGYRDRNNTIFSIRYLSDHPNAKLVDSLQIVTGNFLKPVMAVENARGCIPFILAAAEGDITTINTLKQHAGDYVNKVDDDGYSALTLASLNGHLEVIKALLVIPKIKEVKNNDGFTALMVAAQNGHLEIVRALLTAGSDVNAINNNGVSALILAAKNGHLETVRILLAATGIDVKKNHVGITALMNAVEQGHAEIVQALLAAPGIIVHEEYNAILIPLLELVIQNNHFEIVRTLLTAPGANFNAENKAGIARLLLLAANKGQLELVQALLAAPGIDVDVQSKRGNSLMLAAQHGHLGITQALLTAGADVNAKGNGGVTALMYATLGDPKVVEALLAVPGIEINARNNDGGTAEEFAIKMSQSGDSDGRYSAMVKLFQEARIKTARVEAEAARAYQDVDLKVSPPPQPQVDKEDTTTFHITPKK